MLSLVRVARELWKFGSHERDQRGTPIILFGEVANGAAEARYATLRQYGAAAGYTVTAGRVLVLTRVLLSTSATLGTWNLGSGTDDIGMSSVAAPTGDATHDSHQASTRNPLIGSVANTHTAYEIHATIAAGRLPRVRGLTASCQLNFLFYGHEVAA